MCRTTREQTLPQFGLKHVFAAVTFAALVFGAIHWLGLGGTVVLSFIVGMAVAGYRLPRARPAKALGACGGLVFGTSVVFCLVLPAIRPVRTPSYRSMCNNSLKEIGLGLQMYADIHGCLPPAYVADNNGRPMHSWRVLILPYIEQKALFAQYDFNEPWDGPHNRLLANRMPTCYQCPMDRPSGGTVTSYVAITGPETLLGDGTCTAFPNDVKDGTSMTLAVVEIASSGINWMEPRDLAFTALAQGINPARGSGISSCHPGGALVVFGDGHTGFLQQTMPIADLKALATKAGGEVVSGDY